MIWSGIFTLTCSSAMMLPRSSALRSNTLSPGIVGPLRLGPPSWGAQGVGYLEFQVGGGTEFPALLPLSHPGAGPRTSRRSAPEAGGDAEHAAGGEGGDDAAAAEGTRHPRDAAHLRRGSPTHAHPCA